MKKLLFIFATILIALSAQAQTRYQLQANDIVTISRVNGSTRNYLTMNENNGLVVHNEPNDNSLWVIYTSSYASSKNQYTLKHYKTERYLKIDGKKSGNWWNQTYTITPSLITDESPTILYQDQPKTGENGVYEEGELYFSYDNKKFELSVNNSNAWAFQQNGNQALQVEKWERQSGTDFASYFSPETYDFNLVTSADKGIDNTNVDRDEDIAQQRNVRFVVDLRESNYLACKHKDSNGNPTSDKHLDEEVTVGSDLTQMPLSPTFQWSSSKTAVSSLHASGTTGYLKNYLYESNEHARDMLQFQKGEISDDNLAYELTLQSLGTSPIGLKREIATDVTSWVNYVDYLVASWEYGGNTYTDSMRVIRKSYHTKPLPEFEFSVSPSTYTFDAGAGSQTFTIKGTHQHGTGYYDVDARLVDTVLIYGPVDMPLNEDPGKLSYKFSCLERNSETVSDWLSVRTIDAINNTITLNAEANGNGYRQARLIVEVDLKQTQAGINDPHNTIRAININQRSDQGTIDFRHQEGASYKNKDNDPTNDLDKNDRQQVHTAERVIYYQPEQNIELRLAESNFFGYMRWYDYDSNGDGGDPMWNDEAEKRTTWVTSPRGANGNAFRAINTSYGNSRGLYATAQDGQLTSNSENNPAPVLKGWDYGIYDPNAPTEEQKTKAIHTIACDVSAYTDYTLTDKNGERDLIVEPTLSYRQLFHLRPAEEIAAKLNTNSAADKYLENYHYMAAVGADVHLATQFRYTKYTHESELCYFYLVPKEGGGQELKRVGKDVQAKWYKKNGDSWEEVDNPNYQVYDYLNVDSDIKGVQVYALKVPKASTGLEKDLLIAQFEINFVDINSCGPRTTPIITDHEMELHFQLIKKIDFNYPGNEVTYDGTLKQLDAHLPWDESSYGYYYPRTDDNDNLGKTSPNRSGQNIPYYGEYFLVNQINKDWAKATAHGGTNDYALYVDGTTEPGLVASISTDNVICAGQTLYCSVWLNNPCPTSFSTNNPRNPIFRCNVQGKRKDVQGNWSDWEDISVFFVGQLPKGSGWQQVVFPVTSDYTYDETRVSIYNFATGGAGNDFMVDDITLFASRLPLASYQAQTNCASDANTPSSTAAILRIDYTAFEGIADHYMYYQIYNTSKDHVVELTKLDGKSAYYHDVPGEPNSTYGSVHIPENDFDPKNAEKTDEDWAPICSTVQSFKDSLVNLITPEHPHVQGKAYIRSTIKGQERWLLYVMHIIPNAKADEDSSIPSEQENKYLWERYDYALRMANVPEELAAAECNMQTPLHATQATHFDLYNGYKELKDKDFIPESANNCANDYYTLQANIVNSISPGTGGTIQPVKGPVLGDWLVGYPFDDVYTNTQTRDDISHKSHKDSIETARTEFYKTYGYYREEVTSAIVYDLRRNDPANTNRLVTKFEELDANAFEYPARNYAIIKNLYEKGLLILGQSQTSFYLASQDTARYWFFPIDGTATGTMTDVNDNEVTVTLQDCTEPIWVRVSSQEQPNYFANIAPLEKEDKSRLQRLQLPTVRITKAQAGAGTITIPVTEIGGATTLAGLEDNKITINLNPLGQDVAFVDIENGTDITTTPELVIGQTYLMRIRMKDGENVYIGGSSGTCRVGTIYFYLMILPNTVVWTPATGSYNGWGLDENWRGWDDKNTNGVYDADELMEVGFVPVAGSDVIIPTLSDVTLYPYIHDHNHYPMDVNAHPSICNNIYFAPGAHIHNQHLLQYEKAFVDMSMPAGKWNMMSAPLQDMYSGDMFVPHTGLWDNGSSEESTKPFEVAAFAGRRHTDAAYAFWQGFYNQANLVNYAQGNKTIKTSVAANFVQSNTLSQPLQAGAGFQVYALGPGDNGNQGTITVRLPKKEDSFEYYNPDGTPSGQMTEKLNRENAHKLAFTATKSEPMSITLTNHVASEYFVFGNPTMAYINMHDFLYDNDKVVAHTFYRLENESWNADATHTMGENRYLAPMTSVMLKANEKGEKIKVVLKPEHLTLTDLDDPFSKEHPEITPATLSPRTEVSKEDESEIMNIYAYTNGANARTVLATFPVANDYYLIGEDALYVSSGIETSSYITTPLNMYTVAEQVPMMADVRQGISEIPLGMVVADGYRTTHMQVAFYLSSNWSRVCYFCDSKTGQKIRIMDGLVISVEMPLNHEQRYYIEGPDQYIGSGEGGVTTSTSSIKNPSDATLRAYSLSLGEVTVSASELMREVKLYDMAGRLIGYQMFGMLQHTTTLSAPAGVCIVEAILQDGTSLHAQTIVR